jgi:hypothetical protein
MDPRRPLYNGFMPFSDFLNVDLAAQAGDLSGEIHKVYQRTNLSGKNAAVDRLQRQANRIAEKLRETRTATSRLKTQTLLEQSRLLVHECVPLMDLCLKKNLLSAELHQRWTRFLKRLDEGIGEWETSSIP